MYSPLSLKTPVLGPPRKPQGVFLGYRNNPRNLYALFKDPKFTSLEELALSLPPLSGPQLPGENFHLSWDPIRP